MTTANHSNWVVAEAFANLIFCFGVTIEAAAGDTICQLPRGGAPRAHRDEAPLRFAYFLRESSASKAQVQLLPLMEPPSSHPNRQIQNG